MLGQINSDRRYIKRDSSINLILHHHLKSIVSWNKYENINRSDVTFIKFKVKDGSVDSIVFTGNAPEIIITSFTKALQLTETIWKETGEEVFLLPVVYIFEKDGHKPNIGSSTSIIDLLKDIYQDPKLSLPGQGNYEPLKCVLLNPYFIKTSWE